MAMIFGALVGGPAILGAGGVAIGFGLIAAMRRLTKNL
jgi:hypothetical protein